jgi:DNA-binding XRE family transcriptional regulator
MKKEIRNIPRIIKINGVKGSNISVMFNNGESRVINFIEVLKAFKIRSNSTAGKLQQENELLKAEIQNGTISFSEVRYMMKYRGKSISVPFEVGADVLYKMSTPDENITVVLLGDMIKKCREKAGMTQIELAEKSGTSRTYISRLENNRSDIEMGTLQKIVSAGLGKQLDVRIK